MKPRGGDEGSQGDLFSRPRERELTYTRDDDNEPPPLGERIPGAAPAPVPATAAAAAPAPAARPAKPKVISVGELVRVAARAVEAGVGGVWVEGEISNYKRHSSGHLYFVLKDDEAQLPVVMWRSDAQRVRFAIEDGMHVRLRGRATIYEQQGKFQMYASVIEAVGAGEAALAFEQLKKKLEAEGLFDRGRKRPLPWWPRRVGVVTSATGAAVRDIIRVLHRRAGVPILIAPAAVQGEGAAQELVAALVAIARVPDVDVIIIGRGGGSAEDLAAFNDERLARAIAACPRPVISAVGHEVDFTIADFVADERAPTPSAAAERAVPVAAEIAAEVADLHGRLVRAVRRRRSDGLNALERLVARLGDPRRLVERQRHEVDALLERAARAAASAAHGRRAGLVALERRLQALHPRARLTADRAALAALAARMPALAARAVAARRSALVGLPGRLGAASARALAAHRAGLAELAGRLQALSPLAVLERGYGLVRAADGRVLTDAGTVAPGDRLHIKLRRGQLRADVIDIDTSKSKGKSKQEDTDE